MQERIKTSYSVALLASMLLGSLTFINWANNQSSFISFISPPRSQLAQLSASLSQGLIAYYTFDDGAGTVASDSTGSFSGTLVNGPVWITGKIGGALQFDGIDDYVDVPTISGTAALSYSLWFKTSQVSGAGVLIDWGQNRTCRWNGVTANHINCPMDGSSSGSANSTSAPADGNWHHLVLASTGSTQELYIDGVRESTASEIQATNAAVVRIAKYAGGSGGPFAGAVDDVRIYNRALSATEIQELFTNTASAPPPPPPPPPPSTGGGLVAYYTFDEGSGSTAGDSSGNGNNGVLVGGPLWVSGKVGGGLQFNGSSNYVQIPYSSSFNFSNSGTAAFTVVAWLKPKDFGSAINKRVIVQHHTGGTSQIGWDVTYEPTHFNTSPATFDVTSGHIHVDYVDPQSTFKEMAGTIELPQDNWYQFAFTYDKAGAIAKIYVNGQLDPKGTDSTVGQGITLPTSDPVTIGGWPGSLSNTVFNGIIDDVRIYNKALTQSEIQSLYSSTVGGGDTSLPTGNITSPAAGVTVSNTVTIQANASDNVGVAGVQFKIDGVNLGAEDTTSPYSASWNTTSYSNILHNISARIRDVSGNFGASNSVVVTVNNGNIPPPLPPLSSSGTYSVKQDGTGDFSTIQTCANLAKAGETCMVYTGTYQEHVSTKAGGMDDSHRITFKAQGTVTMQGFLINHPYITVDGFDITNYSGAGQGDITIYTPGNNCKILNNYIHNGSKNTNTYGIYFYPSGVGASDCLVQGNKVSDMHYVFLGTFGSRHQFLNNIFENQNGWDYVRVFGHDHVFRRNIFRIGVQIGEGGHTDFVQTFGDPPGYDAYNMLFEENWIQDLDSQLAQLNSGSIYSFVGANIHHFIFKRNIFVNVSSHASVDVPSTQFINNTFYRVPYGGGSIDISGSLTRGDASNNVVLNNAFVGGGLDTNDTTGYYSMQGGGAGRETFCIGITQKLCTPDNPFTPISDGIFLELVGSGSNNYITWGGRPLAKLKTLAAGRSNSNNISNFTLSPAYDTYKAGIYDILLKTVDLDDSITNTFNSGYNFVSGAASRGYPAKKDFLESNGINGGDPKFANVNDPDGPDNIPFTPDDGLKPLPGSPLCGKGAGGVDIGAYSCNPSVVFVGDTSYVPPLPPSVIPPSIQDTIPPTLASISASSITSSGVTISWTTNEAADTQVEYGLTTAYGNNTSLNSSLSTNHSQILSNLQPNTAYHYKVKSKDAAGNLSASTDKTFTTLSLIDVTPPLITISGLTTTLPPNTSSVPLTITTNEFATCKWGKIANTAYASLPNTFTSSANGLTHATTITGLMDGINTAYIRCQDSIGNVNLTDSKAIITVTSPALDTDMDGVLDSLDKCLTTPLGVEVNTKGCPLPKTTKFSTLTNLANLDLNSVSNFEIGNSFGKITWNSGPFTLVKSTGEPLDIDSNVSIIKGVVTLDSIKLPELNKSAIVTLYNLDNKKPLIFKNGTECTTCQMISYHNGTIAFSVPGFSTYSIVEDNIIPATSYTVTVSTLGNGNGNVTGQGILYCGSRMRIDCDETLAIGSSITFTAIPEADSEFEYWNWPTCGGKTTCMISSQADVVLVATFAKKASLLPPVILPIVPPKNPALTPRTVTISPLVPRVPILSGPKVGFLQNININTLPPSIDTSSSSLYTIPIGDQVIGYAKYLWESSKSFWQVFFERIVRGTHKIISGELIDQWRSN